MTEELKKIKKLYGENMAHLCRELFPTILEQDGLLLELLLKKFLPSKFLYNDIVEQCCVDEFKNLIFGLLDQEEDEVVVTDKTPFELLSEAGYELYECKTEEEIQSFKKYYNDSEKLCTFKGGRLQTNYVFFAVKKDVEKIKREDFSNPKRQDLYGTSVISIQFTRGEKNTLSIKNRYNHGVMNPDATFSNNLEKIIPGLSSSFEKEYHFNLVYNKTGFELNNYVMANDGRFYKYNSQYKNVYYCPNNIIIDNLEVKKYDTDKYLVTDIFILDLEKKEIKCYDQNLPDAFIDGLINIDKITIMKTEKGKEIKIKFKDINKEEVIINLDKANNIISLYDPNIEFAGEDFLAHNRQITNLSAKKLKLIGNNFLYNARKLETLNIPSIITIGNSFLKRNTELTEFFAPFLVSIGDQFLAYNEKIKNIYVPLLEKKEDEFIKSDDNIR